MSHHTRDRKGDLYTGTGKAVLSLGASATLRTLGLGAPLRWPSSCHCGRVVQGSGLGGPSGWVRLQGWWPTVSCHSEPSACKDWVCGKTESMGF